MPRRERVDEDALGMIYLIVSGHNLVPDNDEPVGYVTDAAVAHAIERDLNAAGHIDGPSFSYRVEAVAPFEPAKVLTLLAEREKQREDGEAARKEILAAGERESLRLAADGRAAGLA